MAKILVVTADDLGASEEGSRRILSGHRQGIITAASLMVNEPAAAMAVHLCRECPDLDVGLHLTLSGGRAALDHSHAPHLVSPSGRFRDDPAGAGLAYWFRRAIRLRIADEVRAQFDRFIATGLRCSHADGHQHLHVHPVVWDILIACCKDVGARWVRIPFEEWRPCGAVPSARRLEWLAMRALSRRCRRTAAALGLRYADRVCGHINSGRMSETCLLRTLEALGGGVTEVYLHPGASDPELHAVTSESVRQSIAEQDIRLTRFTAVQTDGH